MNAFMNSCLSLFLVAGLPFATAIGAEIDDAAPTAVVTDPDVQLILDQLDSRITFEFQSTQLSEVVTFFRQVTNIDFVIDTAFMQTAPPPVTLKANHMRLSETLDHLGILTNSSITIRSGAILIKPAEPAGFKFPK